MERSVSPICKLKGVKLRWEKAMHPLLTAEASSAHSALVRRFDSVERGEFALA